VYYYLENLIYLGTVRTFRCHNSIYKYGVPSVLDLYSKAKNINPRLFYNFWWNVYSWRDQFFYL